MQFELNFYPDNHYLDCESCDDVYCQMGISFKCDEPLITRGMYEYVTIRKTNKRDIGKVP